MKLILIFCSFLFSVISINSREFILTDYKNVEISKFFDENILSIIIFARKPCCHDCFMKLDKYLAKIKKNTNNINLYLIINSQDNIISRRLDMNYFRELLLVDSIFFDQVQKKNNKDSTNNFSFFKKYNILGTPSVLLIYKDKEIYFPINSFYNNDYSIIGKKIEELQK